MTQKPLIRPILKNKNNEQLVITIPKKTYLKEGDYVKIEKIPL